MNSFKPEDIVKDFLSHYNYKESLVSFKTELLETNSDLHYSPQEIKQNLNKYLLVGKHEDFLNLFQKIFNHDEDTLKIGFLINLYFTLFPLISRNNYEEYEKRLKRFKKYLDFSGIQDNQCMIEDPNFQYFLLPYIKDPKKHSNFSKLCTKKWKLETIKKIKDFIDEKVDNNQLSISLKKQPLLDKLIENNKRYMKLYDISMNMLKALEGVLKGKKLNSKFVKVVKQRLIEDFKIEQNEIDNENSANNHNDSLNKSSSSLSLSNEFHHLNFNKLKHDLYKKNTEPTEKIYILQALRWRINKTTKSKRKEILFNNISNDIINTNYACNLINNSKNEKLVEYYLMFINSILIHMNGIIYISKKKELVKTFLGLLEKQIELEDSVNGIKQYVIIILQKLSIRLKIRKELLHLDTIKLIVRLFVEKKNEVSEMTFEFGFALLMNLILTKGSMKYCEKEADYLLKLIYDMIDCKIQNVRTYSNGCLYSLLKHSSRFKKMANNMNLYEQIEQLKNNMNNENKKQLSFIQEVIKEKKVFEMQNESVVEEKENWGEFEMENDTIISDRESIEFRESNGEKILSLYFATNRKARTAKISFLKKSKLGLRKSQMLMSKKQRTFSGVPEVNFSFDQVKLQKMIKNLKEGEIENDRSGFRNRVKRHNKKIKHEEEEEKEKEEEDEDEEEEEDEDEKDDLDNEDDDEEEEEEDDDDDLDDEEDEGEDGEEEDNLNDEFEDEGEDYDSEENDD